MEKTLHMPRINSEEYAYTENRNAFTCDECKGQFEKPILATLSSEAGIQKYFACPHCLAEVTKIKHRQNEEHRQTLTKPKDTKRPTITTEPTGKTACQHNPGYLRTRPKNTPIPEECLTCDKMVDCMLR